MPTANLDSQFLGNKFQEKLADVADDIGKKVYSKLVEFAPDLDQ